MHRVGFIINKYFRHVSNNQVFIISKSVQADVRYVIVLLYKQSGPCQDVFDTSLPEDEHLFVRNMSKTI